MRRLLACLLLLALVGAGTALADHQEPQKRITKADQARAKAMLLKRSDLGPGFAVERSNVPDPHVNCPRSVSEADLTLTGDAEGDQFVRGTVSIGSGAQVFESVSDATASWRRGTSAAGTSCLRTFLRRGFARQGIRVVSLGKIAFPRLAERTIAFRAELSATAPQGEVRAFVDLVVLMHSRAHASMIVASVLTAPERAEVVRLARLLAGRMDRAMR